MGTGASGDRFERAAFNQALFREVNERLQTIADTFQHVANTAVFACECASLACVVKVEMSLDEYEALRTDPNRFAVLPGHVVPEVENVVSENDRFVVVAKLGEAAQIVRTLDPRS